MWRNIALVRCGPEARICSCARRRPPARARSDNLSAATAGAPGLRSRRWRRRWNRLGELDNLAVLAAHVTARKTARGEVVSGVMVSGTSARPHDDPGQPEIDPSGFTREARET